MRQKNEDLSLLRRHNLPPLARHSKILSLFFHVPLPNLFIARRPHATECDCGGGRAIVSAGRLMLVFLTCVQCCFGRRLQRQNKFSKNLRVFSQKMCLPRQTRHSVIVTPRISGHGFSGTQSKKKSKKRIKNEVLNVLQGTRTYFPIVHRAHRGVRTRYRTF